MDEDGTPLWLVMDRSTESLLSIRGFGPKALEELHGIMKQLIEHAPIKLTYYMRFDDDAKALFFIRHRR